jgi:thioredoxin 1
MSEFNVLINGEKPVLVDFSAEWCGPCKALAPILSEVSREINGKAKIIKVDIDRNQQAANHYGIRSVPTLLLFKQGRILWKQSGLIQAKDLLKVISQYI